MKAFGPVVGPCTRRGAGEKGTGDTAPAEKGADTHVPNLIGRRHRPVLRSGREHGPRPRRYGILFQKVMLCAGGGAGEGIAGWGTCCAEVQIPPWWPREAPGCHLASARVGVRARARRSIVAQW